MVHHAESGPWYLLPRPFSCAKICCRLDRRQAVRHWVLVPAFAGSNPAGPATMKQETPEGRFFVSLLAVNETGFEPKVRPMPGRLRRRRIVYILPVHCFLVVKKGATRAPGVGVNRRYDISPNRDCKMRDRCEV